MHNPLVQLIIRYYTHNTNINDATVTTVQIYKDAVRLQLVYLQERDRLCADGKLLWSPALSQYSLQELLQEEVWLLNIDNIIGEDVISQCLEECAADSVSPNQNFEL